MARLLPPELQMPSAEAFLLSRPGLTWGERYTFSPLEGGQPLLYCKRPLSVKRLLLAGLLFGGGGISISIAIVLLTTFGSYSHWMPWLIALNLLILGALSYRIAAKNDWSFSTDPAGKTPLWTIVPHRLLLPDLFQKHVLLKDGQMIGAFLNRGPSAKAGPVWEFVTPEGRALFRAELHSRSLVPNSFSGRGFSTLDFVFVTSDTGELLAELNRQAQFTAQYSLVLHQTKSEVDPAIVFSMAVLLDSVGRPQGTWAEPTLPLETL